jgi:hypothetical protein
LSEILLEELLEKRDFYLYTIKHLEFKKLDEQNSSDTLKLMNVIFEELKKVENEIQNLLKQNNK